MHYFQLFSVHVLSVTVTSWTIYCKIIDVTAAVLYELWGKSYMCLFAYWEKSAEFLKSVKRSRRVADGDTDS